jgi:hypothetical protein
MTIPPRNLQLLRGRPFTHKGTRATGYSKSIMIVADGQDLRMFAVSPSSKHRESARPKYYFPTVILLTECDKNTFDFGLNHLRIKRFFNLNTPQHLLTEY